jgi:hypothetical protein
MMSTDITSCVCNDISVHFHGLSNKERNKRPTRTNRLAHLCYTLKISFKKKKKNYLLVFLFAGQQFHHPRHFDAVNGQFDTETKLLLLLPVLRVSLYMDDKHAHPSSIHSFVSLLPALSWRVGPVKCGPKFSTLSSPNLEGMLCIYTTQLLLLLLLVLVSDPSSLTAHCLAPI